MTTQFTGERVVPGHVDRDLWNEHYARYAFAARLCRGRRVLDIGCGNGYGTTELAASSTVVIGTDVAADIVAGAEKLYARPNVRFVPASASRLPFPDESFDLVVAFEVIEHLAEWPDLIAEARRVLTPAGQFIVSTPNKAFYTASRGPAGVNPFHVHEFEYNEFRQELSRVFPHVSMFLQDHAEGILIQATGQRGAAEVRFGGESASPEQASFFIAVCAATSQVGAPTFVYLPTGANLLRERLAHIARLQEEVRKKTEWLSALEKEHAETVELFRRQTSELEERNRWADELNRELESARGRVVQLQDEVVAEQRAAQEAITALEQENARKTEWALATEERLNRELSAKGSELAKAVELLDAAEKTVEERTAWALRLDRERDALEQRLAMVQASRWVRLGRVFGMGPEVRKA